jgi:hypothetical protein
MKPAARAVILLAVCVVAGCAGGAGSSPSAPASQPSAAPQSVIPPASASPSGAPGSSSPTSAATESAGPAGSAPGPTSSGGIGGLHACSLLTVGQASQLNGVSYGSGVEHQLSAGAVPGVETAAPKSSECVWQASGKGSVTLQVVADSSPAGADARLGTLKATLKGFAITSLSGFANGAFIARSKAALSTGGIYAVDGSTFFDLVYLQGTTPGDSALQQSATTIMGSLP